MEQQAKYLAAWEALKIHCENWYNFIKNIFESQNKFVQLLLSVVAAGVAGIVANVIGTVIVNKIIPTNTSQNQTIINNYYDAKKETDHVSNSVINGEEQRQIEMDQFGGSAIEKNKENLANASNKSAFNRNIGDAFEKDKKVSQDEEKTNLKQEGSVDEINDVNSMVVKKKEAESIEKQAELSQQKFFRPEFWRSH